MNKLAINEEPVSKMYESAERDARVVGLESAAFFWWEPRVHRAQFEGVVTSNVGWRVGEGVGVY